jgi:hypothetical protein
MRNEKARFVFNVTLAHTIEPILEKSRLLLKSAFGEIITSLSIGHLEKLDHFFSMYI